MIKVKALTPDRRASKPRSKTTKVTEFDATNLAFCTMLEWQETGSDYQQFRHIAQDDKVAPASVRCLFIYLVKPNDTENIAYGYNPVNVLPVTEDIDDALSQIQTALGVALYKCRLTNEILIPMGYPTKGLLIDRKRYKAGSEVGDCWINLLSVTDAFTGDASNEVVIANEHPQPVPPLEYRLTFQYDPDFTARYEAATHHHIMDYANSFPPDDGSGDWFYRAISQVADIGRHGAIAYNSDSHTLGGFSPFVTMGFPPPELTFWMARVNGISSMLAVLNYDLRGKPEISNYTALAMEVAADGYSTSWGADDFDKMTYPESGPFKYIPDDKYGVVPRPWTLRTILPTLPLMAAAYMFDRSWTPKYIDNRKKRGMPDPWFILLHSIDNLPSWMKLHSLADVGPLPAGESELLRTLFNVLANRPGKNTILTLTGRNNVTGSEPGVARPVASAYSSIRFALYTFPDEQTIFDAMGTSVSGGEAGYVQQLLSGQGEIDFSFDTYPVTSTFTEVLKQNLDRAGFKYT